MAIFGLLIIIVVCVAGILATRHDSIIALRALTVFMSSVAFALAAWFVWYALWSMQIVPVDSLLRSVGVYQLEGPWFRLIFLGPPLLAAALFATVLWKRLSSGPGK